MTLTSKDHYYLVRMLYELKIGELTHYYSLTMQLSFVNLLIVILKNRKKNAEEIILMREVEFREKVLGIGYSAMKLHLESVQQWGSGHSS